MRNRRDVRIVLRPLARRRGGAERGDVDALALLGVRDATKGLLARDMASAHAAEVARVRPATEMVGVENREGDDDWQRHCGGRVHRSIQNRRWLSGASARTQSVLTRGRTLALRR